MPFRQKKHVPEFSSSDPILDLAMRTGMNLLKRLLAYDFSQRIERWLDHGRLAGGAHRGWNVLESAAGDNYHDAFFRSYHSLSYRRF